MPGAGIEPAWIAPRDFKSLVYTRFHHPGIIISSSVSFSPLQGERQKEGFCRSFSTATPSTVLLLVKKSEDKNCKNIITKLGALQGADLFVSVDLWYNINMKLFLNKKGFSLIEVLVATAIFLLFAVGIYSALSLSFKIVYQSRIGVLETNTLSEQLELARNLAYENVGTVGGSPSGTLFATQTLTRNGVVFNVTTTVRNIDDPFDGVAGGSPNDTAPADYKLVEMTIACATCNYKRALTLSTRVAPKRLEGDTKNGSLFIHVFDADGQDLEGANVSIVYPAKGISINDITDSGGMLRLIDTPTGTLAYYITSTKAGYSTDYTISPSSTNGSDPVKLPATVASQSVTEINFAIDLLSNLTLHTINSVCAVSASKTLGITGEKLIAGNPDIPKFYKNFTTDAGGNYSFPNIEWDTYNITSTPSYDIGGSIPMIPLEITPGLTQDASIILVSHTSNSILVKVRDAATGLPLSDASVQLTGDGYDTTLLTGLGFVRQTDWSKGSGQTMFVADDKYFSDSGTIDEKKSDGDVLLKKSGSNYAAAGWLESSTFDLGTQVNFNNIIWQPLAQPSQTGPNSVRLQIATSNSSSPSSWVFTGPDGATSTYYTATSTIISTVNNGKRYFRYRLFLSTANTSYTPEFSEVSFTYTTSCTPPGQAFFSGLNDGAYTLTITKTGYDTSVNSIDISGNNDADINLSPL